MNVGTLREMLKGYDDDEQVLIAYQPSWPLAAQIESVTSLREQDTGGADWEDEHHGDKPDAVWIVAGSAPHDDPYAPTVVFESNMW